MMRIQPGSLVDFTGPGFNSLKPLLGLNSGPRPSVTDTCLPWGEALSAPDFN